MLSKNKIKYIRSLDLKKNRNIEGTGLGLAITKRIIQRHGGEINTEALDGEYTKAFVVRMKIL